jgi:uncharacterized MAPEG superfamily protein
MTFALFTILLVAIMPIVCVGIAKKSGIGKHPRDGGYDNRNPRDWLAKQEGYKKWAIAAQHNCFEALPFYAAAVIVNHILGGAGLTTNSLAIAFVVLRCIYVALYLKGVQGARSLVWILAFAVNALIFMLPVFF